MLSHGNLMVNAHERAGRGAVCRASAVYLHAAPMFHLANGAAMYSILLSGGSNVIIQGFTPEGVTAAFQNDRVTDVLLVPTMIQILVDHPALGSYDTVERQEDRLRRVADQRSRARSRHVGVSQRAVHPGLRHDGAVADRDAAALERTYRRRPRQGPPSRRQAAPRWLRGARSSTADEQAGAVRHGRRDRRPRRQCDDGLLGAAGRNRHAPSSTAGCIPATAATWTRTASSSSSTASRT